MTELKKDIQYAASRHAYAVGGSSAMVEPINYFGEPTYFVSGSVPESDSKELEARLRRSMPWLESLDSLGALTKVPAGRCYVLLPVTETSFQSSVSAAAKMPDEMFFVFIGEEISVDAYKHVVKTGHAEWVSARTAPQEILDFIAQHHRKAKAAQTSDKEKLALISFVPSAGGVGNASLAIETAIQINKRGSKTKARVCLVDLDVQTGHVCDLLDIEARLDVAEVAEFPNRLDEQLMSLFISHHSSGLDVVAGMRCKNSTVDLNLATIDALFAMLSKRYDWVLVDLPVTWSSVTEAILSASDLALVTGSNTVPGLRRVVETVSAVEGLQSPPKQVAVVFNRCKTSFFGGTANKRFVARVLKSQRVFYVREDVAAATQSANAGIPVSVGSPSSRICKDVAKLGAFLRALPSAPLGKSVGLTDGSV